jgi:hypothetical protein
MDYDIPNVPLEHFFFLKILFTYLLKVDKNTIKK